MASAAADIPLTLPKPNPGFIPFLACGGANLAGPENPFWPLKSLRIASSQPLPESRALPEHSIWRHIVTPF